MLNKLEELILEEARNLLRLEEMAEEKKHSPVLERRIFTLRKRLKEDIEEWKKDKWGLDREIKAIQWQSHWQRRKK